MEVLDWLMDKPDSSLEYQVRRDLLGEPEVSLEGIRGKIAFSGFARVLLQNRNKNGHWGNGVYNPKWICTHYVLLELMQLEIPNDNGECRESARLLLDQSLGLDGGINYAKTVQNSDVCINGAIMAVCSYFRLEHERIPLIIDYLLAVQMRDGGWNCEYLHGAVHSSLHTTISVLEGISRYLGFDRGYRAQELAAARQRGVEFILRHELFKSEKTGETIKDEFFKFAFPVRWKYDILRCLDYFRASGVPFDARMAPALAALHECRGGNGIWKAHSQAGKTFQLMEKNGADGKWNTLRALRVFLKYKREFAPK